MKTWKGLISCMLSKKNAHLNFKDMRRVVEQDDFDPDDRHGPVGCHLGLPHAVSPSRGPSFTQMTPCQEEIYLFKAWYESSSQREPWLPKLVQDPNPFIGFVHLPGQIRCLLPERRPFSYFLRTFSEEFQTLPFWGREKSLEICPKFDSVKWIPSAPLIRNNYSRKTWRWSLKSLSKSPKKIALRRLSGRRHRIWPDRRTYPITSYQELHNWRGFDW